MTVEDILYFVYDGWQVVEEHEAVRTDDLVIIDVQEIGGYT